MDNIIHIDFQLKSRSFKTNKSHKTEKGGNNTKTIES